MADELKVQEVKTEEVKAQVKAETETKTKRGRKKGSTKATSAKKPGRKPTAKTTAKKTDKNSVENPTKTASTKKAVPTPELNYKSITIEFNDKKFSEKDLYDRVKSYISTHPYIVAHDIELFIKPNDSCAYFTIDGFSNPDFRIDL